MIRVHSPRKNELYKQKIDLEYSTLMEEFRCLRAEIVSTQDFSRQVIVITFTAIGLLAGASAFIISNRLEIIFLIFPLFLYGLAWTQIRFAFALIRIGKYLEQDLIPKIRQLIAAVPSEPTCDYSHLLAWQFRPKSMLVSSKGWLWLLPISGSHFGTVLLAAVLSIIVYLLVPDKNPNIPLWSAAVLIAVNVLSLIYSIYWGFRVEGERV